MRFKFKKIKLNFKTLLPTIALIMAVLSFNIVAVILYSNTTNYLKNKITGVYYSNMNQMAQKIEICFSEVESLTKRISGSNVLKEHLDQFNRKKSITFDNIYISQEIRRFMENAKKYTEGVDSILIITPDENFFVGEKEPTGLDYSKVIQTPLYKMLPQNSGKPVLMHIDDNDIQNLKINNEEALLKKGTTLFVSRIIFDKQEYGIIVTKISDSWVKKILNENHRTAIIDKQNILWKSIEVDEQAVDQFSQKSKNEEGIFELDEQSKPRVFYKKLSWGEWYLTYFEDVESSKDKLKSIGYLILVSLLISIAISISLSRLILNKLIEPFNNLIKNVRRYKTEEELGSFTHRKKDRFSMRDRILLYFALVIVLPLSLFIMSYYFFSWNMINEELVQSQKITFNQTADNISLFIERKLKAISSMSYDRTIQEALIQEPEELQKELLYQVVNSYLLLTSGYDDISVFNIEGKRILSTYNKDIVYNEEVESSLRSVTGKISWLGTRKDELNRHVVDLAIKVSGSDLAPNFSKYILKHLGNIVVTLNEAELEQIYRDIYVKSNANIYIIDSSDFIVSNIDKSLIGLEYKSLDEDNAVSAQKKQKDLTFSVPIKGTPWVLVGEYDYKSIFNDFKPILYYCVSLLVVICLLLVIISYEISYRVANSIGRMNKLLNGVQLDGISPIFPRDSNITEVDELALTFNDMVTRIDTLIDDLVISKNKQNRLEMQKRDAEILALQSQIKPHFLCNTLESIRCLVKEKKENQAVEMLKNVSDLFRYGISKVENHISIKQELAHAAAYTNIMAMRFENITFEWKVEEEIKEYLAPKMILQPIIENAIYHGIVPKKSPGRICIDCRSGEEHIIFTIFDDGVGMDEQRLVDLNSSLKNVSGNRIGLENVQKRLKLYFGDEYNIKILSTKGEGSSVIVEIPKIKNKTSVM